MGLRGGAAVVGYAQRTPSRHFTGVPRFSLEQWAELAADALSDAGIDPREVDGVCVGSDVGETSLFSPATVAEYCGWSVNFAERLDLGGASSVGMLWRAAAAIELGLCDVVVCACASAPRPQPPVPPPPDDRWLFGASSNVWGSPQAEFDIPYGNLGQNAGFAMYAQRYHDAFGWDERSRAKIASDQRTSACVNPDAVFFGQPLTPDDVLASRLIASPLHMLEIVMPVSGGAAIVVTSLDRAQRLARRPVVVTGFGEHLTHKTPTYAPSLDVTPIQQAAHRAFTMANRTPSDVDMVQLYDCYTITVLLTIEDSGFCGKGEGLDFVANHDLSYAGDFPCNTHGGQLGFGQPGLAGGMSHVIEAVAQIQGRAGARQLNKHDTAYVSGTGGIMSEQTAVLLEGA
jgi:acetyl-CoA acetyltransferase